MLCIHTQRTFQRCFLFPECPSVFFKLTFVSYAVPRSGLWGPLWWACCSYCSSSGLSGGKVLWHPIIVNSQQWYHENGSTGRIQEQGKHFNCSGCPILSLGTEPAAVTVKTDMQQWSYATTGWGTLLSSGWVANLCFYHY